MESEVLAVAREAKIELHFIDIGVKRELQSLEGVLGRVEAETPMRYDDEAVGNHSGFDYDAKAEAGPLKICYAGNPTGSCSGETPEGYRRSGRSGRILRVLRGTVVQLVRHSREATSSG